jgi:hypothetical protein
MVAQRTALTWAAEPALNDPLISLGFWAAHAMIAFLKQESAAVIRDDRRFVGRT